MPWVAGQNLRQLVEASIGQRDRLESLASRWLDLTKELRGASYVHGDPSHRNVMIDDRGIHLIDPDVAWVPALGDTAPVETGNPAFQHPGRARARNSLELDNFPNIVIYLSLRALASDPSLWQLSGSEKLILDGRDYAEPHVSEAFTRMLESPDAEVRTLTARLMQLCLGELERVPPLEDFLQPAARGDVFEREKPPEGFVLPPNSRRASWLAAHLPNRSAA
jgi:hypothetical protein